MVKWPRRIGCFVSIFFILLLLAIIIIFIWHIFYPTYDCGVDHRRRFPSPDHAWTAVIEDHYCAAGPLWGGFYAWSEIYLVTERPVPLRVIPILTTGDRPPELVWTAPDMLQLRVRWPREFVPYLGNADGVRIDMRYDTAAWIDWHAKWDRYDMETGRYYIDGGLRVKLKPDPY